MFGFVKLFLFVDRVHLMAVSDGKLKFTYFPLFAKGPACALALEHSGVEWEGANPVNWKEEDKALTPWNNLPTLDIPGIGLIGHEQAILSYIGSLSPKMGGDTQKDRIVSDQILNQAEDIYTSLHTNVNKISNRENSTPETVENFWTNDDRAVHCRSQGVRVHLRMLEEYYNKNSPVAGAFTTSGVTVGECKLFVTLTMLKLMRDDCLTDFPGLAAFYDRLNADEKTLSVLQTGAKMPQPFKQYFV